MDESGTKILVEDNQNDVEEILVAREGQEAPEDLHEIKIPKVDMLEVVQRIKADPGMKATPVVPLTSSREEQDLLRSYNLGTTAYKVKPFNEDRLFWGVITQPPSTAERES